MIEGSWAVAGRGNVGGELMHQIAIRPELGLAERPQFMVTSQGVMAEDGIHEYGVADIRDVPPFLMPDVLFLANPTTADGQPALLYMEHALRSGKMVITAEKGAISRNYRRLVGLSDGFDRLGIAATVGGGSLIMPRGADFLQAYGESVSSIVGVVNGTLQATFGEASNTFGSGMTPEDAIAWSQEQGFAEPGKADPFDVLRGEIDGDVPKKLLIFMRHVLGMNNLAVVDFQTQTSDETIRQAFLQDRRYVIALANVALGGKLPDDDLIGGMTLEQQGWLIRTGFMNIGSTAASELLRTTGPMNGLTFNSGDNDSHTISGPGAGAIPTVNAMLADYRRMSAAEPDPTLADRVKSYRGGKPRRVLSADERAAFLADLHRTNVATMRAAGLKLAFSEVWQPGFKDALTAYWTSREQLVGRHGSENVLNGPGVLQSESDTMLSMGIWVPEGDGERWRRRDQDLDLINGHWELRGGPDPEPPRRKLLSIFA